MLRARPPLRRFAAEEYEEGVEDVVFAEEEEQYDQEHQEYEGAAAEGQAGRRVDGRVVQHKLVLLTGCVWGREIVVLSCHL